MGAINVYSPKAGSKIQVLFFAIKLAATIVIIFGGFYSMGKGETSLLCFQYFICAWTDKSVCSSQSVSILWLRVYVPTWCFIIRKLNLPTKSFFTIKDNNCKPWKKKLITYVILGVRPLAFTSLTQHMLLAIRWECFHGAQSAISLLFS